MDGLDAAESRDLFFAKLSLRLSLCSFNLDARSFWYSAASDFAFAILFFLSAILALFLCNVNGVTNLCIFGALLTSFPVNIITIIIMINRYIIFLCFVHNIETLTSFVGEGSAVCINILSNIIFFREIKKFADFWRSFGTSHPWFLHISQTRKIIFTLFHNNQI